MSDGQTEACEPEERETICRELARRMYAAARGRGEGQGEEALLDMEEIAHEAMTRASFGACAGCRTEHTRPS